jgi:hypothetical protein
MKTSKSIAAAAVLVVMMFLVMGATEQDQCKDDSIAELKAKIDSLEQRVERLEKKSPTSTTRRSTIRRRPQSPSREQSPPRGWRRKEFNGLRYYVIPLDQEQSRSRRRSSTKSSR